MTIFIHLGPLIVSIQEKNNIKNTSKMGIDDNALKNEP
jgi:hypothetical protein